MKNDIIEQTVRRAQVAIMQLTPKMRIKHADDIQYELKRIANWLREENLSAALAAVYDLEQLTAEIRCPRERMRRKLLQTINSELNDAERQARDRECFWHEQIYPQLKALRRFIKQAELTPPEEFNAEQIQSEWETQLQTTIQAIKSIRKQRSTQREIKQAAEMILMLGK